MAALASVGAERTSPAASPGCHGTLADLPVPMLNDSQLSRFTFESLRAAKTREFDPRTTLAALHAADGIRVLAIDIGGDKMTAGAYVASQDNLVPDGAPLVKGGSGGAGYLDLLTDICRTARRDRVPVGVSYAGPTEGSKVLDGVNVPVFIRELGSRYGGDLLALSPDITLVNDAEAGLLASALVAARTYSDLRNVVYVINGSGIGGAVFSDGTIYATEAGHVQIEDALNSFSQRDECGLLGARHVCIERIAASKAGIESAWAKHRGAELTGKQISSAYLNGDRFALQLYDISAYLIAHVFIGIVQALQLPADWDSTVLVAHGGAFHVPGYGQRVRSVLTAHLHREPRFLMTKDFSFNTCLDGAAVAAVGRVN